MEKYSNFVINEFIYDLTIHKMTKISFKDAD